MSKVITDWKPEDPTFWKEKGRLIANRNLWISVPALLLAFVVWQLWSVIVVFLPRVGFHYTQDQLMMLTALPALSGATLRIFYAFMVPIVGGRRWTVISTASLLIPLIGFGICVQNPNTSFTTMAILALLCGFGGANFSSSMSNIGYFFPKSEKGSATGINAGLGNLGVPVVQFVVPWIIGVGIFGAIGGAPQIWSHDGVQKLYWLQNAAYIWVIPVVIMIIFAWFGMNDLSSAKASFSDQAIIFKRPDNWLMCWLYLGAFGSFIGFSAALPLLIKREFPEVDPLSYAFLGPLLGSIFRVVGGTLSDKFGGERMTLLSFIGIIICVFCVLFFLPGEGHPGSFIGFLISFLFLFTFVGLANGSTFAQVPGIFLRYHQKRASQSSQFSTQNAIKESGAVLGFMGAIGAYGGFLIPKFFGYSITHYGSINFAFYCLIGFYVSCVVINWFFYLRKGSETSASNAK